MSATFRVLYVFSLTGRGPVVVGELLTGTIRPGGWIVATAGPALRVGSVESVYGPDLPPATLGLVACPAEHRSGGHARRLVPAREPVTVTSMTNE